MGVRPRKTIFGGHPSRMDDFPCNLTQFCYIMIYDQGRGDRYHRGGLGSPYFDFDRFDRQLLAKATM